MAFENQHREVLARIVGLADGQQITSAKMLTDSMSEQGSTCLLDSTDALEQYLHDLSKQINKLHIAMMRQDLMLLEELVEDIKRGAGSYGLRRVTAMADRLDQELEDQDDLCGLVSRVSALSDVCHELIGEADPQDDDFLPGA